MKLLQEKLDFLLDKYSVDTKAVLKDKSTVVIEGKEIPLLSHRSERRFSELKNLCHNGTLKGLSVMRSARIVEKGADLNESLYRELDICQWILQSNIKSIFTVKNENTMNVIAKTENDIVCTIELSATLRPGTKIVDKHEIISQRGIACDKVVDTQIMQESIYVYGDKEEKFTDVDFELYGLDIDDIAVVRQAFVVARDGLGDELITADANLKKLIEMSDKSIENCEKAGA